VQRFAHELRRLRRDAGALYRGVRLTAAREAFLTTDGSPAAELNAPEGEFLAAGIAEHERAAREAARTARRTRVLTVLPVVTAAAALVVWVLWFLSREHP